MTNSIPTERRAPVLIFVPTYNEAENVERLFAGLREQGLDADVLFVDDNSTDGTGTILDGLAAAHPSLHVLHRPGKQGVGSAHLAGIRWAYDHGYRTLVTMDCDFTHPPEMVPVILDALEGDSNVVVGSRYLEADSLPGWSLYRKFMTHAGHHVTSRLLGIPHDATGAFRAYRLDRLPLGLFELVGATGYAFFPESLLVLARNGHAIREIPIALPSRTYGHSKMGMAEVLTTVRTLLELKAQLLLRPEEFRFVEPLAAGDVDPTLQDGQGWEHYWTPRKAALGGVLYDAIAVVYRRWVIRPTLTRFARKHFPPGATVLHAGCGSGQVDTELHDRLSIVALDISVNALRLYKQINPSVPRVLHGSIFRIPLADESVDGVYNLGVMEHFTEDEIDQILRELSRVVRPGGRIVLFWPPEHGLSVLFFKGLGRLFAALGQPGKKFHPDEITRLRSRRHGIDIVKGAGLAPVEYAFGPRDAFTYSVLVAERPAVPS